MHTQQQPFDTHFGGGLSAIREEAGLLGVVHWRRQWRLANQGLMCVKCSPCVCTLQFRTQALQTAEIGTRKLTALLQ